MATNEPPACSLCQRRANPKHADGRGGWLCHLCRNARSQDNGHRNKNAERILPPQADENPSDSSKE